MKLLITLSLLIGTMLACNGDDDKPSSTSDADAFVGIWKSNSNKIKLTCSNGEVLEEDEKELSTITIKKNSDNTISAKSDDAPDCERVYTVAGKTANLKSKQSCSVDGLTVEISSSVLTLSGDGKSVDTKSSIGGTLKDDNGEDVNCTGTSEATANKQ